MAKFQKLTLQSPPVKETKVLQFNAESEAEEEVSQGQDTESAIAKHQPKGPTIM